jgi:pimeloyl-ACP methyl ester carboxylesterase/molybdopterin-guanine dinucleotide biosynthesis protein
MSQDRWVRKAKNKNGLKVIFIHGINSSEDCWKNSNGVYWPELLKDESELADVGIYVFSYRTGINTGSYSLSDIVDSLREYFTLDNLIDSVGIIFVCHSMGGIVARRFLVNQHSKLLESGLNRVGLFLVASPSLGSEYANMLGLISSILGHTQASALKFSENNLWLNDLDKDFTNLRENKNLQINGKELIEDLPLYGKGLIRRQVVQPFSGAKYFGNSIKVPGSDHSTIAAPACEDEIQHRLLVQFIKECIEKNNDSRESNIETPNLSNQAEKFNQEKTYENFLTRTDEVNSILVQLESNDANKVISLVGLGGIGKTALCHYVVTQAYTRGITKKIIWIRAKKQQFNPSTSETQSIYRKSTLTFEQALQEISDQTPGITNDIRQDIDALKKVITKSLTDIHSLVVIDGLEDSKNPKILATDLKSLLGNSRLILTTRKEVDAATFKCDVNKMNPKDSRYFLEFMARYLNCETILKAEESKLSKILNITDGMPLAMKLVVSHHAKYWDIDRIIDRLSSVSDEGDLYNYIFEDAWQELLEQSATDAQSLLIHLSGDSEPIPLPLLYGIKNFEDVSLSKTQVDDAIKLLKQLSLVEIKENVVSLHSLTSQFFGETLRYRYA